MNNNMGVPEEVKLALSYASWCRKARGHGAKFIRLSPATAYKTAAVILDLYYELHPDVERSGPPTK